MQKIFTRPLTKLNLNFVSIMVELACKVSPDQFVCIETAEFTIPVIKLTGLSIGPGWLLRDKVLIYSKQVVRPSSYFQQTRMIYNI